ncbi:MAG TPA: 30S ribosomal protein S4e [Candidatus Thermoplasmatota archaeon]|jgi:small subunit ribosomal protein S4e|nr:30S ribosomal protein S4e [Candidatus Thermoplasmatota archaeon]
MSKHLKRLAVPRQWSIPKKVKHWAPKPAPGPHAGDASIPLLLVLRDYLKVCDTAREARAILNSRTVMVDQRVVTDPKRSLGLMDVLTIGKLDQSWRVLLDTNGRLALAEMNKANAGWKLCRIEDKTTIHGGATQLNLHDGRNIVAKEAPYKTGDVLKVKLPEQKVMEHYPMNEGSQAFITGGSHVGENAAISKIEVTRDPRANLVHLKAGELEFLTIKPYVFVVGKDKAEIRLPEERITAAKPWRMA